MIIHNVFIKNFRCIKELLLSYDARVVCITGKNGAGKTSVLEALHFASAMRSFRTHLPKELINFDADSFFIKVSGERDLEPWSVQVGSSSTKRLVRVNEKAAVSFKDIMYTYRTISITEDDLLLIQGSPEVRRSFVDWGLILSDPEYIQLLKTYKKILTQRNALLFRQRIDDSFGVWTQKLIEYAKNIQERRSAWLHTLEDEAKRLLATHNPSLMPLTITYQPKLYTSSSETHDLFQKRTTWGPHIDDVSFLVGDKASRHYSSRGQQKMLAIILKVALLKVSQQPSIILVDDFFTDFDTDRSRNALDLLINNSTQLIITTPMAPEVIKNILPADVAFQAISL